MSAWLRLIRPGDWTKNVFVLVPLVFWLPGEGRAVGAPQVSVLVGDVAWMLAAFCLAASGFYAINDAIDARSDRIHPVKRRRPVASGSIGAVQALVVGMSLVVGALVCTAMVSKAAIATFDPLAAFTNAISAFVIDLPMVSIETSTKAPA
jgi:4-hydroxybenzoate polyprenyltransferase